MAVSLVMRLLSLGAYPLADTTEARYSEIARLMLESGNWITLQVQAGVPFWGKPPLSIWATALSFSAFGISEFAARLPALAFMLATAMLLIGFARDTLNRDAGLVAACVLLTSVLGFVAAGAVMTDAALTFSTTLAMVAFWRATMTGQRGWAYAFFVALGAGLLAKGPIALVLILAPITLWLIWRRRGLPLALPWLTGTALTLAIAAPWYLLAESKTPGFIEYFIVGEHWMRFVDSGWSGDLYGSAHAQARGTIWLFWLASALPWSLIALWLGFRWWQKVRSRLSDWHWYLIVWAAMPMLFFSFAGNILPAYVLPGLPAFALLLGKALVAEHRSWLHAAWLMPVFILLAGPTLVFERIAERSQQVLIRDVEYDGDVAQLMYAYHRPHSANFYSAGRVRLGRSSADVQRHLDAPGIQYVALRRDRLSTLSESQKQRTQVIRQYARFVLLREIGPQ
ncbi:MAG: glycosyltransferase family 39 protein [Gammaproteobacteria bacterium]|nr:glycosyltransferase family 39 protein [Gammaproteobacteria bacterium]